jgi:16S rRNA (guanine527-N7)-methyltransferase
MDPSHIAGLLAPFLRHPLADEQLWQLSAYLDLLLKWNAKTNLTAIRDPEQIVARHFGESLFAAEHLLAGEPARSEIDLGSGAGFPGLPIAIYAPQAQVTLIESQNKKATFLKEVARSLPLENVTVFSGRGETYPDKADVVTMRAVERFGDAVKVAAKLVTPGGRLALLVGADQTQGGTTALPDFHWSDAMPIPLSNQRVVWVGRARPEILSSPQPVNKST